MGGGGGAPGGGGEGKRASVSDVGGHERAANDSVAEESDGEPCEQRGRRVVGAGPGATHLSFGFVCGCRI